MKYTPIPPSGQACAVLAGGLLATFSYTVFGQGILTPPAGLPQPTMKTLQQIEPRVDVHTLSGASSAVFVISAPGSYFLSGSISGASGKSGIQINASHVSLDLNGFEMVGGVGSSNAITAGTVRNITLRNGTIRNWGFDGVSAHNASSMRIDGLQLIDNVGIGCRAGTNSVIANCVMEGNYVGILANIGSSVMNSVAVRNTGEGFLLFDGCSVINCTASYNRGSGGIFVSYGCTVVNCTVSYQESTNSGGIYALGRALISGCQLLRNRGDGIQVLNDCYVTGNNCIDNDGAGIRVLYSGNRIDGNNVTANNSSGIRTDNLSALSLVIRNSAQGNSGGNYNYRPGTRGGQILSPTGTNFISSDPWANFSF